MFRSFQAIDEPEPVKQRRHFRFLDGVRGWASLAVVFYHLQPDRPELRSLADVLPAFVVDEILVRGQLGVAVFFVLSGFVIAYSLRGALASAASPNANASSAPIELGAKKPFDVRVFMARRFARLTPPYYAAIAVALVFAAGAAWQGGEPYLPGGEAWSFPRFATHLFYGQELFGYVNFNDVFWTLGLELQFYAVLAGLVVAIRWIGPTVFGLPTISAVCTLAAVFAVAWPLALSPSAPRAVLFPPLFFSFLLGVLVFLRAARLIPASLIASYLVVLTAMATFHAYNREFVIASILSGLVLWCATEFELLDRLLVDPVSQFLGRVSYSLYLVHTPVIGAALVVVSQVGGATVAWQFLGLIAAVASALLFSAVLFYAVEQPAVRLSRSIGATKKRPLRRLTLKWN